MILTLLDMGCGEEDGSFFMVEDIQPDSFNTTRMIMEQIENIDFVLHIGDISYARGFSAVVSTSAINYSASKLLSCLSV